MQIVQNYRNICVYERVRKYVSLDAGIAHRSLSEGGMLDTGHWILDVKAG